MKKIIDTVHHYFIPRHTNNYNAKLLHHDFLTVYLFFALLVTVGVTHLKSQGNVLGYATDVTAQKLYELTNKERAAHNLSTLQYNDNLSDAARQKGADMFEKNYWAHYGPQGETPWDFILESGYQYEYAGENLAKNFLFSDDVVSAWMDSPTHKENILRKEYTDVGFAVTNGVLNGEETTLVVQMFGAPLYAQKSPEKAQEPSQEPVQETNLNENNVQENAPLPEVLANESENQKKSFIPFMFNMNILFFAILGLALILDFYFAAKLNLIRVKGKNLIHVMFIGFIIIGAYILIKGSIS